MRDGSADAGPAPSFVTRAPRGQRLPSPPAFDAVVAGGTLGALFAAALTRAAPGIRIALVEAGKLRGRAQDWNICRAELDALVTAGCLSAADAASAVTSEFNPVRAAFPGAAPYTTTDVLNLGVSPDALLRGALRVLDAAGATMLEETRLAGAAVHDDGVSLLRARAADPSSPPIPPLTARLVVDATGSRGPFARQARWGSTPDGACLVVGTCAVAPWADNATADVIAAVDGAGDGGVGPQYFWEAFPAAGGGGGGCAGARTTYMFQYVSSPCPSSPSLTAMLDAYWERLPGYQGPSMDDVDVRRVLFGVFPSHRASPLAPSWDRVLHVGDAAGVASPLSFGGLGALARHGARTARAVADALSADALDRAALAAVNPYNPGLSAAWMLQSAMSASPGVWGGGVEGWRGRGRRARARWRWSRPPAPPAAPAARATRGVARHHREALPTAPTPRPVSSEKPAPTPDFIPRLLAANFAAMGAAGDAVARPFLRDTLQFTGLAATLARQVAADPRLAVDTLAAVGPGAIGGWFVHFIALGAYAALYLVLAPFGPLASRLPPRPRFFARRALEALEYGSGLDFKK